MTRVINRNKIALFIKTLYDNEDGLWIREISRRTGLAVSTVHHYINILSPILDETLLGEKPLMRVVRLKPEIIERIDDGLTVDEILRTIEIVREVG